MNQRSVSDEAKAVVSRNTEEVQGKGRFEVFEELFADDFVDHTTQPGTGMTPDKAGVRKLYTYIREAFPDFHAEIHWQLADGDRVTTYKTYYGTHDGTFLGIAPTHRKIHFESVDVMRVRDGKITDHWGVGNLLSLMQQIGGWTPSTEAVISGECGDLNEAQSSIRGFPMRLFNNTLLRLLLFTLGQCLALASRIIPSVRSQVTRTLTFEISTDDGVARQWHFNGQRRRITTGAGRSRPSTNALRFPSSGAAVRVLLSPHWARLIADGIQHGTTRIEGALFAVYWFFGLTRKLIAIGRENGPRGPLPNPYLRHDPRSNGSEQIIIEPAIERLDPKWTNAWEQRAKLLGVRATTGEPMQKV